MRFFYVSRVTNQTTPRSATAVHLILGAGDYMRIKTNEKPRVGKIGEPVAERTKFGCTILAQWKELDYSAMFLTQTSQCDYVELCRMDVLGLADNP